MTIKQKFSSIDQSKLTADQKAFLTKIKDVTKNFTDAEMNKKVEAPLNGFIEKAKEKMPEAIKSAPVKRTGKAKTSQTKKPKRTAMSLAKEIRKEGESWNDARARASKMMKEDSKDLSKTVETELDKLSKLVRSQKSRAKLSGLSGTNIKRDSVRRAKPKGRRISKDGNVYYENRDNRTDRLAPNYPKNAPYLAEGGYLTDPTFGTFQNQVLATGGSVTNERRYVNKDEDYEVRYSRPRPQRKGYLGKRDFELGGVMATDLAGHTGGKFGTGDPSMLGGFSNTAYTGLVGETGAMSSGEMFEHGGGLPHGAEQSYMITESFGNPAQHFAKGGGVFKIYEVGIDEGDKGTRTLADFETEKEAKNFMYEYNLKNPKAKLFIDSITSDLKYGHYAKGGGVKLSDLKVESGMGAGKKTWEVSSPKIQDKGVYFQDQYTKEEAKEHWLENVASKYKFAKGGGVRQVGNREYSYGRNWTNDHRHINKAEDHEVKYTRKGKFLGIFKEGGELGYDDFVKNEKYFNSLEGGTYVFSHKDESGRLHFIGKDNVDRIFSPNKMSRVYATGGAIKNQYAGRTPEDIWDSLSVEQRKHFLIDHLWANEEQIEQIRYKRLEEDDKEFVDYYAVRTWKKLSGDVRKAFTSHVKEGEYNKGGALTNERLHVNHDEDYEVRYAKPRPTRKGYKGARKFMAGGMNNETPRIYVADLEAYNNGRLVGEWLDLSDYNDADELMDAIQDVLKKSGGEEYAIHDYENFPSNLYSEYMSRNDFQALYDVMETAKRFDLPLEVVQDIVSQYGEGGVEEFYGKFDSAEDFAYQQVEEVGLENFSSPEYYVYITDTDRRLLAGEMADSYVDDIRDEDGGNRVIEEAGMDVLEYQEADSETQEEMLDRAVEIVRDEYYDNWYDGLSDPYYFLVDEQGMYSPDDFFNASFISVDYEKLARDLEQDYTFIEYDGDLYVFNIR